MGSLGSFLDPHTLIASLIWGGIGIALITYGRKMGEPIPALGGVLMVAVSYVVHSALWMSVISIGLIAALYASNKLGYW